MHSTSTALHVEAAQASSSCWPVLLALVSMLAIACALGFVLVRGVP